MYMDEKMDSGDIIYQEEIKIEQEDNVGTLFDKLSILGSNMIIKILPDIIKGNVKRKKQDENKVTYAYNITREDEKLDFNNNTIDIHNKIRGLNPWPVAYAILDEKKVKIFTSEISNNKKDGKIGEIISINNDSIGIKTKDGEILIKELQFEGKKKVLVKDYLNGIQDKNILLGKIFK